MQRRNYLTKLKNRGPNINMVFKLIDLLCLRIVITQNYIIMKNHGREQQEAPYIAINFAKRFQTRNKFMAFIGIAIVLN